MKKIIFFLIIFCLSVTIAHAGSLYNYPYLHKGIRSLGMGGTFTAVGKDAEALFYNPAGLYDMGFQLALLNPQAEVDQNFLDMGNDLMDAMDKDTDTERMDALTEIISNNMGKPLHLRFTLFPHVAVKNVVVGAIGQGILDSRLHNPLSSEGAVEVSGGYEYGPVLGASIALPVTGLRFGVGAKYIINTWIDKGFTIRDIATDGFDPMDYKIENKDYSFDAGFLYDIPILSSLKPKAGIALLDITDLDFQDENGKGRKIPMRGNVGISLNPTIPYISDLILALDYQDFMHNYEQDNSTWKRVHAGAELGLLGRHLLLRGGFNQGYATGGAELDLWVLKLAYTYYSEEMGAYAGQDKDTRHLAQLSIGW